MVERNETGERRTGECEMMAERKEMRIDKGDRGKCGDGRSVIY